MDDRKAVAGSIPATTDPQGPSRAAKEKVTGAPPRLAKNTLLNMAGAAAPMAAAVVAIPILVSGLGAVRFGVLAMAWGIVGYFGVLDLGLGRAVTQMVAERIGTEREPEIPTLVWTALLLTLAFGWAGAALLVAPAGYLVRELLDMPPELHREAAWAVVLLGLSLPLVTSMAGLRGVLEATHQFGALNAIRLPMGLWAYLGPVLILPFSRSLIPVVAALLVGRFIGWVAHLAVCLYTVPFFSKRITIDRKAVRPLLLFGGWMTISNLASSVMIYFDRFLIGAVVSVAAVTYYVTPYEVAWRLTMIPSSLLFVLFPIFAATALRDRSEAAELFDRGARIVYLIMFPITLLLVVFAGDLLGLWLGPEFARNSTVVLRWLALGSFFLSVGMTAATALQGAGLPKATGLVNLVEIPIYVVGLYWLVSQYGIVGAAIAWAVRAGVDAVALCWLVRRYHLGRRESFFRLGILMAAALPMLFLGTTPQTLGGRFAFAACALIAFSVAGWRVILAPEERTGVRASLAAAGD
ncbi:MAG: oligosaccharide flippase family protein [Gemmatimonas sp.]|nr:oligosaccharide flippase family protein [Gemmatimonas sp.]